MKKTIITLAITVFTMITNAQNPFMDKLGTPHGTIPFDKIRLSHYEPAFMEGIRQDNEDIQRIVDNPEKPTFENTIAALDASGKLLTKVSSVFFNLMESKTSDEMNDIANRIMPVLTDHRNDISLNEKLFARVKAVYEDHPTLNPEQQMLLETTYKGFVRTGAKLNAADKEKLREISKELSSLVLNFSQNNLKEVNKFVKIVTDSKELEGLSDDDKAAAAQTAKEKGYEGWAFTLQQPSYIAVMTYCKNRALRKEMYMAHQTNSCKGDELDNQEICRRMVNLRMQKAQLLGYATFADYKLEETMAQNSKNVYRLLNQLLDAYRPTALKEVAEITELAQKSEGNDFKVMPWDWSYYSNILKNQKFQLNNEMLRPYFELEAVKKGVFGLATKLYGITFKKNTEIPVYDKDVDAYEVYDKDGKYLAVLYTDFFPRDDKQSGAWMNNIKDQWIDAEGNSRPHVMVTMNFTKPTADKPALLTFDEVSTFLHEFGHALHGMFANTQYASLSGTSVYRDFVELPSQIMENFATEPDFLKTFAKHYQTGEIIPNKYIDRIKNAANFNAGYSCLRQLSFGLLDMAYYTRNTPLEGDLKQFEKEAWKAAQVLPQVENTCMTTSFGHIMEGGYSAGYYSYKWAEVLDADAFAKFKEDGIFNTKTAQSFRNQILSKGGTVHPSDLYRAFRGQDPSIEALLERNDIKLNKKQKEEIYRKVE